MPTISFAPKDLPRKLITETALVLPTELTVNGAVSEITSSTPVKPKYAGALVVLPFGGINVGTFAITPD